MKMHSPRLLSCLAACGLTTLVAAVLPARGDGAAAPQASPATRPATQPTTMPSPAQLKALMQQLGADEFKSREAAMDELRKLGKAAIPALKEALASKDPEVQTRVQTLIREAEDKDKPKPAPQANAAGFGQMGGPNVVMMQQGRMVFAGGGGQNIVIHGQVIGPGGGQVVIRGAGMANAAGNGMREATITENGDTYTLHSDADGIKITSTIGGKTTEYKAKDVDDLKKNQPEGYKIYEKRFANEQAGAAAGGPQALSIQGGVITILPMAAAATQPATQPSPAPTPAPAP